MKKLTQFTNYRDARFEKSALEDLDKIIVWVPIQKIGCDQMGASQRCKVD